METLQIEIINPKANKLLKNLADMNLIAIKENYKEDGFLKLVNKIRTNAKKHKPTLEEITKEVEIVRSKRYAKSKKTSKQIWFPSFNSKIDTTQIFSREELYSN